MLLWDVVIVINALAIAKLILKKREKQQACFFEKVDIYISVALGNESYL